MLLKVVKKVFIKIITMIIGLIILILSLMFLLTDSNSIYIDNKKINSSVYKNLTKLNSMNSIQEIHIRDKEAYLIFWNNGDLIVTFDNNLSTNNLCDIRVNMNNQFTILFDNLSKKECNSNISKKDFETMLDNKILFLSNKINFINENTPDSVKEMIKSKNQSSWQ